MKNKIKYVIRTRIFSASSKNMKTKNKQIFRQGPPPDHRFYGFSGIFEHFLFQSSIYNRTGRFRKALFLGYFNYKNVPSLRLSTKSRVHVGSFTSLIPTSN